MRACLHSPAQTFQLLPAKIQFGFIWPKQVVPVDGKTAQPRPGRCRFSYRKAEYRTRLPVSLPVTQQR